MARWKTRPTVTASLDEESQELVSMNIYAAEVGLRLAEPRIPEVYGEDGWLARDLDETKMRRICEENPEHPATGPALGRLEDAEQIRREALTDG